MREYQAHRRGILNREVNEVSDKNKPRCHKSSPGLLNDLRLSPQGRLCARFDGMSMADYPTGVRSGMGFPVVDNCVEEHIQ